MNVVPEFLIVQERTFGEINHASPFPLIVNLHPKLTQVMHAIVPHRKIDEPSLVNRCEGLV